MTPAISTTLFSALVQRGGGVDAAAAVLSAVAGHEVNKSTVSRMCSGQINVTPEALWAMEDHCRFRPFSEYVAARLDQRDDGFSSPLATLSTAIKEANEGLAAAADVADGGGKQRAIDELREGCAAMMALLRQIEATE